MNEKIDWFKPTDFIPVKGYFTALSRINTYAPPDFSEIKKFSRNIVAYAFISATLHFGAPALGAAYLYNHHDDLVSRVEYSFDQIRDEIRQETAKFFPEKCQHNAMLRLIKTAGEITKK